MTTPHPEDPAEGPDTAPATEPSQPTEPDDPDTTEPSGAPDESLVVTDPAAPASRV
ncbi:MAG: hypothetical protein ABWX60_08980 [Aeromicrobium sp.]